MHQRPHDPGPPNGRAASTGSWIVAAFNRLVLSQRYESLSVNELSRRAGVGRSTFYEHFKDKDHVLRHALLPILTPLADAAAGNPDPRRVQSVLEHVAENRARTLEMLTGPAREQIEHALTQLILERTIATPTESAPNPDPVPTPAEELEAAHRAGAQIATILAWLRQPTTACPAEQATQVLSNRTKEPRA